MADVAEEVLPVDENQEELVPIAVLIDELRNTELSVRVNAVRKLSIIALALGEERTRDELLPFIADTIYDEDQVSHELSKQLCGFVKFVGGPEHAHCILPALESFANVEEVLVRDEAVDSLKEVVKDMPAEKFEEHFPSLVIRLGKADWFTSRSSACGLIPTACARLTGAKREEIEQLFETLCKDDTPMVRRAAAKALAELVPVYDKELVQDKLLPILEQLAADEQDSVRILTVDATIAFAKHFANANESLYPVQKELFSFFTDVSWRVRYTIAQKIVDLLKVIPQDFAHAEIFPLYEQLLGNAEIEVRCRSFEHVGRFCAGLPENVREEIIVERVVPKMRHEVEEMTNNENVKTAVSMSVMDLVPLLSKENIIEHILPICSLLLLSEPATVRLNVISSFGEVSNAIGVEETSGALLPAVITLSRDGKWRVRLALVEAMPTLMKLIGPEYFNDKLLEICLGWLEDQANAVRHATSSFFKVATEQFGGDWFMESVLPTVSALARSKKRFQVRLTAVGCLEVVSEALNKNVVAERVLPILIELSEDSVPNIRFNVANALRTIGNLVDLKTKTEVVVPVIETLCNDEDCDVRYFAAQALEDLKPVQLLESA